MKKTLLILIIIIILALIGWIIFISVSNEKTTGRNEISISTDKSSYQPNDNLKLSIVNNSKKETICFSSCYPYYFEVKSKDNNWQEYPYGKCQKADLSEKCIKPNQRRDFEISLDYFTAGLNRIKIPVCLNCSEGDRFKADKNFYSNPFTISGNSHK
ncbi:hypothetical protein J7J23_01065 [bacterium]|nr:hypothetical protein [bacterium]